MPKKFFFLYFVLITSLLSPSWVLAKKQPSGTLEKIRQIVDISGDLDNNTKILMVTKSEDDETIIDCVCACRDLQWSCTTTECSAQDDECENDNSQNEN